MEASPALSKNRQRKKSKPPRRFVEMASAVGRGVLNYSFSLTLLVLGLVGAWFFYHRYYLDNKVYEISPEDITFRGNAVLPRGLVLDCFGLNRAQNGFEILRSDLVARLRSQNPLIRSVQMKFEPPHRLEIWVEERTPVARLMRPTVPGEMRPDLAVDRDGYIFAYPKSLQSYPEIGTQAFAKQAEPGDQYPENQRCVLHLLAVASELSFAGRIGEQSSGIKSVALLSQEPDDGLLVTLRDGRKITIAWANMSTETTISESMRVRLQRLATVMRDPATAGLTHFNAMAEDRVAGSE